MTVAITREGTSEATWEAALSSCAWPELALDQPRRGLVVVAAHPDDEVLGVGGLLNRLASRVPITMVWASDGEASHPDSHAIDPATLAATRRAESRRALARLGVAPVAVHHLGLPDSAIAEHERELTGLLAGLVGDDDVVLANWSGDGHPDHEAVGRAAAAVGVTCWQYPIWLWDWALPGDVRVPWDRLRIVPDVDVTCKAAAIAMFASQVQALGPEPEDAAILPPRVLDHFRRPYELVFG